MTAKTIILIAELLKAEECNSEIQKNKAYKDMLEKYPDDFPENGKDIENYKLLNKRYSEINDACRDFFEHDWH